MSRVSATGAMLVLALGAALPGERWPAERFAAVARRLSSGPLGGARVVLIGADRDVARVGRGEP